MTIELPNIKFDGADLGAVCSYFNAAWEAQGEPINRANTESDMAKQHRILWAGIQGEMQRHAQNAFEMGVAYGKANVKDQTTAKTKL